MLPSVSGRPRPVLTTLVTDAFVVRGTIRTRHRRITDVLNTAEHDFVVLEQVSFEEFGSSGVAIASDFAQVNLGAILFGVADEPVEATPELRVPKVSERALIAIPPFMITGHIHLLAGRDLHQALDELLGTFIPVTDAVYWSDRVGVARTPALVVAVNHNLAQILAPHRDVDPWAGLDRSGESATSSGALLRSLGQRDAGGTTRPP